MKWINKPNQWNKEGRDEKHNSFLFNNAVIVRVKVFVCYSLNR